MNATSDTPSHETPADLKAELEILKIRADILSIWHRALTDHIERLEGGGPYWRRPGSRKWSSYDKGYADMMARGGSSADED